MKFKIFTLFPDFFESPLRSGLLGKAILSGLITVEIVNIRDYSDDKFKRCDDYPYGGGNGMVLKAEPLSKSIDENAGDGSYIVLTSASGSRLDQKMVRELYSTEKEICIVCGHYEGVDERISELYADMEISTGDYVLSGGEFAALVIIDSISRLVPGFMSNENSTIDESHERGLLEYPQYTRPEEFKGLKVPEILLSGHHKKIAEWRLEKSLEKTKRVRPDLYKKHIKRLERGKENGTC